jgi:uncharacterized protein (TIGR03435 family)
MKPRPEIIGEKVELLGLFNKVSPEEMESARVEALKYLESAAAASPAVESELPGSNPVQPVRGWQWPVAAAITATVVLALLIPLTLFPRAVAVLEEAAGPRNIRFGEVVLANDVNASTLALADGSRVEMRSKSELVLERAADGVRIRLRKGGIIVNAAPQGTGHLYVQTKDVTVSVLGTVFLVNAEEEGSHVAVIEGEVRVERGATQQKLRPGEQVVTGPSMEPKPVSEEFYWSRHAETHVAALQRNQVSVLAAIEAQQEILRPPDTPKWESVFITPCGSDNAQPGGRGGGGGAAAVSLRMSCVTVKWMIERAYVKWIEPDVIRPTWFFPITGGPSWIDSDRYLIEAKAEGSPDDQMMKGPMLQALLEDRFNLKIRREIREEPVYELRVDDGGFKLKPLKEGECAARTARADAAGQGLDGVERLLAGLNSGIWPCGAVGIGGPRDGSPPPPRSRTVNVAGGNLDLMIRNLSLDRIVLNKTGIQGLFDIQLTYGVDTSPMREPPPPPPGAPTGESIFAAMTRQLGLKLVPTRGPRTYYIIDHADRPASEPAGR